MSDIIAAHVDTDAITALFTEGGLQVSGTPSDLVTFAEVVMNAVEHALDAHLGTQADHYEHWKKGA